MTRTWRESARIANAQPAPEIHRNPVTTTMETERIKNVNRLKREIADITKLLRKLEAELKSWEAK